MSPQLLTRRHALTSFASAIAAGAGLSRATAIAAPGFSSPAIDSLDTTASSYCPTGEELVFLDLINSYRRANGLNSLKISRTLGAAAEHHSQDMAKYDYFSHTLSNGRSWSANITAHGYTASKTMGENIAAGHRTAHDTFNQWKASAPHKRNMLNASFRAIGIGRASNSSSTYGYYWTTTFGGAFDAAPGCL
jgi:uncharacterized protein YkwD